MSKWRQDGAGAARGNAASSFVAMVCPVYEGEAQGDTDTREKRCTNFK